MPFCPKCRYEYLPTVSQCPDCEIALVAALPLEPEEPEDSNPDEWEEPAEPDSMESFDNWIPLARFSSTQLADLVLEALHSRDIPAVLSDATGHFGQTGQMGMSSSAPIDGAVTLFVPGEFAYDAAQEGRIVLGEDWDKSRLGEVSE